ncbi:MAG: Rpp14/Pop5 family protein [Halobacteriaceae archaeon]
MKHLPKHLRPRWRYLAVGLETWPDAAFGRRDFQGALWHAGRALLGDPGSADADLRVLSFDLADGYGEAVVRVRRGTVDPARAAVACVADVDGHPVRVRVRGVSGTVRACEEKYMGGPTETPDENRVVFRNADRRAVVRDGLVDVEIDGRFTGATRLDIE